MRPPLRRDQIERLQELNETEEPKPLPLGHEFELGDIDYGCHYCGQPREAH